MKKFIAILSLSLAANAFATADLVVTTTEIPSSNKSMMFAEDELTNPFDPIERAGKIVAVARDVVALGEEIYTLVQKGKPSIQTDYAPVSVVPKDPTTREVVDVFDLEGFSAPVMKQFNTVIKSRMTGMTVVNFTYKVMYSYNGSYNGKGKYLTSVQVVPASVSVSYGWDFKATMRVIQVMNHGTRENPVGGVVVALNYSMKSWGRAEERTDTFHIAGNGALKNLGTLK
jgi:hypothetical protein